MDNDESFNSFLFNYGGYIVYLIFLIGLFLNGGLAIFYFANGGWLLGIWALCSIIILPKATFVFILISTPAFCANMPQIFWKLFPLTIRKYRLGAFWVSRRLLIREIIWVIVGVIPIIFYTTQIF